MALSPNKMVFATVVSFAIFGVLGFGMYKWTEAKNEFDEAIAGEIRGIGRSFSVMEEASQMRRDGDYEGAEALMESFREKERQRQDKSPFLRRMNEKREARAGRIPAEEDPRRPMPTKRMEGTYYPGDIHIEPESSGPSLMALGLAGGGGLLVFGLAGLVSFRVLANAEPEAEETEEGVEGTEGEGEGGQPGDPEGFGDTYDEGETDYI